MQENNGEQAQVAASASYRGWVLLLMFLMMTFNYMDRSVLTILNQPIKVEFHLTDFELGIMGGPAFAILYMLLSVPIARLAERRSRVSIIAASVVIWSVMTALCGFVRTFGQLLVMRVGVGIG